MIQAFIIIVVLFGVMYLIYNNVTKKRAMEFLYKNKFLLNDDMAALVPLDMIYNGVIAQVKERKDTKIEVVIQSDDGLKEVVQIDSKDAKAYHFPLNEERKYMGGFYYALVKEISRNKGQLTTKVVGADKSQIYLKNKYHDEPFKIHIDHVGHLDPNWSVGKSIKVEIKDRKFHIDLDKKEGKA